MLLNIWVWNYPFLTNYVTSEGAVSHNVLYYNKWFWVNTSRSLETGPNVRIRAILLRDSRDLDIIILTTHSVCFVYLGFDLICTRNMEAIVVSVCGIRICVSLLMSDLVGSNNRRPVNTWLSLSSSYCIPSLMCLRKFVDPKGKGHTEGDLIAGRASSHCLR